MLRCIFRMLLLLVLATFSVWPSFASQMAGVLRCLSCPRDGRLVLSPGSGCVRTPQPKVRPACRLASSMLPPGTCLPAEGIYTVQVAPLRGVRCQYRLKVTVHRCSALKRPAHGGIRCSRDRHWGSRCHFYCYPGYQMAHISSTCIRMDNKMQWTKHPTPFCQEIPLVEVPVSTTPSSLWTTPALTVQPRHLACRWPRVQSWLHCNKKSIVAPEGTVCRHQCPRGPVTKLVCIDGFWRKGPPKGCPPCTAATSKRCMCPKWRQPSCANTCKGLPKVAHGRLNCVPGSRNPGTRCSYVCSPGYVIPKSQRWRNAFLCLQMGHWNHTNVPECARAEQFPKLIDGCRTKLIITSTLPVLLTAPMYQGFTMPASVQCTVSRVETFGDRLNECRAVDFELGTTATCSYNVTVIAPGCATIEGDPFSQVRCSNNEEPLQPIGTVCEYTCQLGYVIPKGKQEWAVKECLANGSWSNSYLSLCERRVQPVPVNGCQDVTVYTDQPSTLQAKMPSFQTAAGTNARVECSPSTVGQFGHHLVTCLAQDDELGTSSSCTFEILVKGATEPRVLGGCTPQELEVGEAIAVPLFLTGKEEAASVICTPERAPLAVGFHNVTCEAQDGRTGAQASCTFPLTVRPVEKLVVAPYFQGTVAFSVAVPRCTVTSIPEELLPTLQMLLKRKTDDLCIRLRCLPIDAQCAEDAMNLVFRFQAEYSRTEDVANAEQLLEQLQLRLYQVITKDKDFARQVAKVGAHILPHSFKQGPLTMGCTNPGFTIRDGTLCVACEEGTFEEHGICHLCPRNTYQELKGQSKCRECPKLRFSAPGAKSIDECQTK